MALLLEKVESDYYYLVNNDSPEPCPKSAQLVVIRLPPDVSYPDPLAPDKFMKPPDPYDLLDGNPP
jgi:hypothetical protein